MDLILATDFILGLLPIAVNCTGDPHAGRTKPSAYLKMIPPREIQLAILLSFPIPPWDIQVVPSMPIFVVFGTISQCRNIAADTRAERVREIATHLTATVGETVRKGLTFGVQQQTCSFAGAGSQDDVFSVDSDILSIKPIYESDS